LTSQASPASYAGVGKEPGEAATQQLKNFAEYEKALNSNVVGAQTQYKNMDEIIRMADIAQPGAITNGVVIQLGQALRSFGVTGPEIDKMLGGKVAALQVQDKAQLNGAINQARHDLAGFSRQQLNQQEFAAYVSKNPNIYTDPRALEEVFNLWNQYGNAARTEQSALRGYKNAGGDPTQWENIWNASPYMQDFVKSVSPSGPPMAGTTPAFTRKNSEAEPSLSGPPASIAKIPGLLHSASTNQYRDPASGQIYDAQGNKVGQ